MTILILLCLIVGIIALGTGHVFIGVAALVVFVGQVIALIERSQTMKKELEK